MVITLVFSMVAAPILKSEFLEKIQKIILGAIVIGNAVLVIRDARQSNEEKKSCSNRISQIGFVFKPDMEKDKPFLKAEIVGWIEIALGVICITIL